MDALFSQLASYGAAGALGAILIYILYTRLNKLETQIAADNDWKMKLIENNTSATLDAANAYRTLTETVKSLLESDKQVIRGFEDLAREVRK